MLRGDEQEWGQDSNNTRATVWCIFSQFSWLAHARTALLALSIDQKGTKTDNCHVCMLSRKAEGKGGG